MKTWKMHWDRQLYKALEHQYQMGLEALNENLPEIKVELVFRYSNTCIRFTSLWCRNNGIQMKHAQKELARKKHAVVRKEKGI